MFLAQDHAPFESLTSYTGRRGGRSRRHSRRGRRREFDGSLRSSDSVLPL